MRGRGRPEKYVTGGTRGVPPSFNFNESPQSENITTEKAKASKITQDFVQSTMPQINSFSKRSSCLWLTAYLVFITVLIGQTAAMLLDFCSHPVNVQVTLETEPRFLDFPGWKIVRHCNNPCRTRIHFLQESCRSGIYQTLSARILQVSQDLADQTFPADSDVSWKIFGRILQDNV